MKTIIVALMLIGIISCTSKESQYKTIKITELNYQVDSLTDECNSLRLQLWAQEELIYSQDTIIQNLTKDLR